MDFYVVTATRRIFVESCARTTRKRILRYEFDFMNFSTFLHFYVRAR